jgi:fatty acid amide hydrolase
VTATLSSPILLSAAEIARRIAQGELSAVEVVQAYLERIRDVNPRLNAIVVPRFDEALREAEQADARRRRGDSLGPLHGVPITVKECFHLAGTPACIGLAARKDKLSEHDGLLVRRLRRAGAIILGKTNIPQMMIWHESDNPVYGRTNNPWDLGRTCGGSTGGEAAIVAARGSALGLGNDLGGSIRVPCHWCGIHGFKATSHRLPRIGSVATLRGFEAIVTQPGPMARHVEDLWLGLQVLADDSDGQTTGDVAPCQINDPAGVSVEGLRLAMWTDDGMIPPSPALQRAVREAAHALRERGAVVEELSPEEVQAALAIDHAFDMYVSLLAADGGAGARRLTEGSPLDWRAARISWLAGLSPPMRAVVSRALRLRGQQWLSRIVNHARGRSTDGYWTLIDHKNKLVRHSVRWLRSRRFDAILCPPHALPAPPHEKAIDLLAAASYAFLFNLLGLPAGVVSLTRVAEGEDAPRPTTSDQVLRQAAATDRGSVGLPVGVQVVGMPWREDVVLAIMQALEETAQEKPDYPGRTVMPAGAGSP